MDDKKKIMIVGALMVVMLGVGAFQFMSSGSPAPAPTAEATDKTTSHTDEATQVAEKATDAVTEGEAVANPEGEKKPLAEGEKVDPNNPAANPHGIPTGEPIEVVAFRDPFDGRRWSGEVAAHAPKVNNVPQQPRVQQPTYSAPRPPSMGGSGFKPVGGAGLGISPEGLPATGNGGITAMGGTNMPSIEDVPYEVTGTIRGKRQAALFKDSSGGQRLVRVGDKLDGDTVVVGVDKGRVLVKHRGKVKELEVNRNAPKTGEKPKTGVENLSSEGK